MKYAKNRPNRRKNTYSNVEDLCRIIPGDIAECVKNILDGRLYLEGHLRETKRYFERNSNILRILIYNPGSSRFTEIVYGIKDDEPEDLLKHFMFGEEGEA